MQKCLGIYVENNMIKYAKISKEKDLYKIEAFGIEICENIEDEIKKIVEETSSFNVPISMNLLNEKYMYFDILGLLSKNDIKQSIETEYESFCEKLNYNKNAFETRYALVENINDDNKIKVIDVLTNTIDLNKQKKYLEKYLVAGILPIGTSIANIAKIDSKENIIIANMEEKTTLTTIYNGQVYSVETIEKGSKEIFEKINAKENSLSKTYELCKQTTIYTSDSTSDLTDQPYLEDIIPTLYVIAQKLSTMIENDFNKISKIYLTGTLANINNVDLYFQEFLQSTECKILKPNFIDDKRSDVNIKDYMEVNSAIALAMQGLKSEMKHLNFKPRNDKIKQTLSKFTKEDKSLNLSMNSFKGALDNVEVIIARMFVYLIASIIIFCFFSKILSRQIDRKAEQIDKLISTEKIQINKINEDETTIKAKKDKYEELIDEIKSINNKVSDIAEMKNSIPNLLNQIMYIMPLDAQIISIENTEEKHIKIIAQSKNYDSLGYFISKMKIENYLKNIVTSKSKKVDKIVQITVEGELP